MGRGDQKTRKGKISKGTFGNTRPRKSNKKTSSDKETDKKEKSDK